MNKEKQITAASEFQLRIGKPKFIERGAMNTPALPTLPILPGQPPIVGPVAALGADNVGLVLRHDKNQAHLDDIPVLSSFGIDIPVFPDPFCSLNDFPSTLSSWNRIFDNCTLNQRLSLVPIDELVE